MIDETKLYNGQAWEQKQFPYFRVVVLMLEHIDHELMFAKVGLCGGIGAEVEWDFLTHTEEDGQWMYTEEQLLENLRIRNYTIAGWGKIIIKREKK